jgi:outer membrane protein assembly factor BamB
MLLIVLQFVFILDIPLYASDFLKINDNFQRLEWPNTEVAAEITAQIEFGKLKIEIPACMAALKKIKNGKKILNLLQSDNSYSLETVFLAGYKKSILCLYQMSDGDSGWAKMSLIDPVKMRFLWTTGGYGFNLGVPVMVGDYAYVTSIGTVAKINLKTGKNEWIHNDLYDSGYYNIFKKIEIKGNNARFTDSGGHVIVINDKTGTKVSWDKP